MLIKLSELEQILKILLERYEQIDSPSIKVNKDYYWQIDSDDRFDMAKKPELMVGSLFDDIAELRKLPLDQHRVSVVDFDRFAHVISAIGQIMYENHVQSK